LRRSTSRAELDTCTIEGHAMPQANRTYRAVIKQDGGWWVGWTEEIPGVNCQARSRAELLVALKQTLGEALEFNRTDARRAAEGKFEGVDIAV
jgi:predicted RNase H-like HicB family nuclease